MISQRSVQQVIDSATIEEVVRDYVDLRQRGSNLTGLCPFHKEKTPSFSVSVPKNIYKCFGCGKGGTPVQFIMEAEQMSFPEAIRHLAKKFGIELEETVQDEKGKEEKQHLESLNIINEFALAYYQQQLWETDKGKSIALSYFKERNFLDSTIRKFQLGYAPDGDSLRLVATDQQYNLQLFKEVGLLTSNEHDFFEQRVMFPIHNASGKVIAFAGRIIGGESKIAKYINSPETILYNKSKTLFGLHLAKKSIRDKDQCILVEGYTDVMALAQAGFENVVASSGTALTEDQAHLLRRFCSNVILLYDGDDAGTKAAMRGLDILIKEDLNVSIALIPNREDPDSFLRKSGSEAFEQFLKSESKDFILFKSELLLRESNNDPIKKAHAATELVKSIAFISDDIKRSVYLKQCAEILQLQEAVLINACNKIIKGERRNKQIRESKEALDRDKEILDNLDTNENVSLKKSKEAVFSDEFQERDIARIIMTWGDKILENNQSLLDFILHNINDVRDFLDNPVYKRVLDFAIQKMENNELPTLQSYLNNDDKEIAELCLDITMNQHEYSNNWEKRWGIYLNTQEPPDKNFIKDCMNAILRFKLKKFSKQIMQLEEHIKMQSDDDDLPLLLKTHQELLNYRNEIAKMLNTVVI